MAKIITVQTNAGKHIMEVQLPHVFTAFPITETGISQMIQDLQEAQEAINQEKEVLQESN